jgi:cell pole-organizing protein PopZ
MSQPGGSDPREPSMEDILASIRNILNEDEQAPLELTESMLVAAPQKPPERASGAAEPPQVPPPVAVALPAPEDAARPAGPPQVGQGLLGPVAAAAAAAALGELARTVAGNRQAPVQRNGGLSIEDVVREEMRPLLRDWLDQHLPAMVERLVRQEIERVMGRSGTG